MPHRVIQVGTGGMGAFWCRHFLPQFVASGQVEVVAAVDIAPEMLIHAREGLGLPEDRLYTDAAAAFAHHPADFCTIVVPPAAHEAIVDLALAHGMDILSEKPIADTLEGSIRIARKVEQADRRMGVTMSHRFDQDKTTFRTLVHSGDYGPLDYLACRFTCDNRAFASWGRFRHEMTDPLLIEGAIHHLDILADLAGAPCETVYAQTWNPPWGEFAGDSQALVSMTFGYGVRGFYEGAKSNASGLNGWGQEYIRAECRDATIVLDHRQVEVRPHRAKGDDGPASMPAPLLERPHWGHAWLLEQFLAWREGGPPMPTAIDPNLRSTATIFAAIESSHSGQPVAVEPFLAVAQAAGSRLP
jgi:predicted dehydrogenase